MGIPILLLKTFGQVIAAHVLKQAPKILEGDADEIKKHCRACGKRIKKGAKYILTRRFRCSECGHRTHVHCGDGEPASKVCRACAAPVKTWRAAARKRG